MFQIMLTAALDNRDDQHLQSLQTIYRVLTGSRFNCQRYGSHWEEVGFQGLWRERERHVNTWVWWKCHTECTTVQFRSFTSTHRTGSGIPQSFQLVQMKQSSVWLHHHRMTISINMQTCSHTETYFRSGSSHRLARHRHAGLGPIGPFSAAWHHRPAGQGPV